MQRPLRFGSYLCLMVCLSCFVKSLAADEPVVPKVTKADVEAMMKDLSNWGRWGKDDQLGTLNLITPAKRRQAAALVKDGVSVSMAYRQTGGKEKEENGFRHVMEINPVDNEVSGAGDVFTMRFHGFSQTHLDALCHIFFKGQMYNGYSAREVLGTGAAKLGVERVQAGIFTKCVLMDIPELLGVRYLDGPRPITVADLEAWEKKSGVKVEQGDAMIINTGRWDRQDASGEWEFMQGSAGLHASVLPWIKERGIALVGSDLALDVMPSQVEGVELPVHLVVVVGMGMPILDVGDFRAVTKEARQRKRWEFLLNIAPLAVQGGTGSPINPIATF